MKPNKHIEALLKRDDLSSGLRTSLFELREFELATRCHNGDSVRTESRSGFVLSVLLDLVNAGLGPKFNGQDIDLYVYRMFVDYDTAMRKLSMGGEEQP